jgi:TPR repeat protein
MLGVNYDNGHGLHQDYFQALSWYRKAAERGHRGAQTNLGVLYYKGNGVKKDYVEADKWFSIASAGGYEDAKENQELMEKLMTPVQVAEAQRLASEWTKEHQP